MRGVRSTYHRRMNEVNPVLVSLERGGLPEIQHRGAYAAVRAGAALATRGRVEAPRFLRSTAKYFQALAALECGIAERHRLSPAELALICASHGGEERHVAAASALLARGGLTETALQCGTQVPTTARAATALFSAGGRPTQLHNNCSGKHAGMLLASAARGATLHDYLAPEHPHQQAIAKLLSDYAGSPLHVAVDGCSAPTFALPTVAAARAFARFAEESQRAGTHAAVLADAVASEPGMLAGEGRFCTAMAEATAGRVQVKVGADGFYGGFCRATGTGLALHIDDGGTNASERVMTALLAKLGLVSASEVETLARFVAPERKNRREHVVGTVRVHLD